MDTSEIYIKMCEKAEEIQNQKQLFDLEDFYEDQIWLPRQDQLQEMIGEQHCSSLPSIWLAHEFSEFCDSVEHDIYLRKGTMEQLWLAFVMKERFGKIWVNEEWSTVNP